MSVAIIPLVGSPYQTNSTDSVDWRFKPPFLNFYWNPADAVPNNFDVIVTFPDYTAITTFAAFTDWKFEADLVHQSTVIFTTIPVISFSKVEGQTNYQGPIGDVDVNTINKLLNFSFENLSLLPIPIGELDFTTPRIFDCIAHCRVTAINPETGLRETISEKDFKFTLERRHYFVGAPPMSVGYPNFGYFYNPDTNTYDVNPMVFNYHIGGDLPITQDLYIFRLLGLNGTLPTIFDVSNANVLTSFIAIHDYYSKVQVTLDSTISALVAGIYNYTITLGYPGDGSLVEPVSIIVPIQLNVLPPGDGSFYVTPENLTFDVVIGGVNPSSKILSLVSDADWNVVGTIPSWLSLSQYSNDSDATLLVNIVNFINLPAGTYNYTLSFTNGTITIDVAIVLNITVFCSCPFVNGGLFFTKDLDYLQFVSQNNGTYVEITASITTYSLDNLTPTTYSRIFKLPLYKKKGDFHLGTIVHQLFSDLENLIDAVPSTIDNYSTTQYKPATIDLTWEEKEYIVNILVPPVLISGGVSGFKMIKGHKPYMTTGKMCLLSVQQQTLSRITQNGVIGISYSHFGMPQVIVKVNTITIDSFIIALPAADRPLYSYFRFNNSFNIGDIVEIHVLNNANEIRTQRYLVVRDGLASTHILFENDNGVMEPFEFTGKRMTGSNFQFTKKQKFNNLFKSESKVISQNVQSLTVNSGDLLPNDVKIIDAIIKSENVWISYDDPAGPYIRVDATTSKITPEDTQKNELNFNIDFNILEDADAKVYPQ